MELIVSLQANFYRSSAVLLLLAISSFTAMSQEARCVACHASESTTQPETSMAHSLAPANQSSVLKNNPSLAASVSGFNYQIQLQDDQVHFSVGDAKQTASVLLQWAFGVGNVGQTYLLFSSGEFYEARVSYYKTLNGLAMTTGHAALPVNQLADAVGRKVSPDEVTRCFACHATFAGDDMTPGVHCGSCHQDLPQHLAAFTDKAAKPFVPERLSGLSSAAMADRCGTCHRQAEAVKKFGPHSIENVRFQPYRLEESRCFIATDQRISCVACHNPHQEVQTKPEAYDSKCQACHAPHSNVANIKLCKVATKDCVTCHMPQVDFAEMHYKFTDHRIHIARAGEAYVP